VNRLGWTILVMIGLAVSAFVAMLGGEVSRRAPAGAGAGPVAQSIPAGAGAMLVPVAGVARSDLVDTWGQARDGGLRQHRAIDIAAPGGTPVVAALPGSVEKLFNSAAGGITAYVRSHDGRISAYYAHLAGYAPGLAEGQRLRAGDPIGFVGDTGNAGAGNTHLHFAISRMRPGDRWYAGEAINPYPLLARPMLAGRDPAR